MVRVGVKIVERSRGHFDIIKERGETKPTTEIEKALGDAVEQAVQMRIDEIMSAAKEHGAETSREVRHG